MTRSKTKPPHRRPIRATLLPRGRKTARRATGNTERQHAAIPLPRHLATVAEAAPSAERAEKLRKTPLENSHRQTSQRYDQAIGILAAQRPDRDTQRSPSTAKYHPPRHYPNGIHDSNESLQRSSPLPLNRQAVIRCRYNATSHHVYRPRAGRQHTNSAIPHQHACPQDRNCRYDARYTP